MVYTQEQKTKIEELVDFLNKCNNMYYVQNSPIITDYEFDQKLKELANLENETGYILPYSPTQKVGSDLQEGFNEVSRTRMMGSIENCYDVDELTAWLEKHYKNEVGHGFLLEPKYDGTSCSIIYRNGIIEVATTRGSGLKGTDITANVKTIHNVPLKLVINETGVTNDWHYNNIYVPNHIEIRGEILLPKSELVRINKEREAQGESPFANERNCAAGSIKQLDPKITASRNLIFKPYAVYSDDDNFIEKYLDEQHKMLDVAEIFGFDSPSYWRCATPRTVIEMLFGFRDLFLTKQDYKMDGCVIKMDNYADQLEAGYTQKVPKWAKAFKFQQERASTLLRSVDVQMGMSGQLGFVANLDPVEIDGTIVRRATLNNPDFIAENDLKLGQYVFVEKGGQVIPGIVGVDYETTLQKCSEVSNIEIPEYCPFCGAKLEKITTLGDDGANLYCVNENCDERRIQKLVYFVKKDCMNIDGVGEEIIRTLYRKGIVKTWQDFYKLRMDDLSFDGFGEVSTKKMLSQIDKSRTEIEADRTLTAMGIRMIGKITAKKVMEHFGSIDNLKNACLNDISAIDGVGDVAANYLWTYINEHQEEIDDIIRILPHTYKSAKASVSNKLKGIVMLATGTLKNFTRDGIQESVIENGGTFASGVSKKVNYILVGDAPGQSKIDKALKLGVPMITEDEYLSMIK